MPIYEYDCAKCGVRFEALIRSSSAPKPNCPECGSKKVEKCFSVFASHNGASKSRSADTASHSHSGGCSCGGCSTHHCATCKH